MVSQLMKSTVLPGQVVSMLITALVLLLVSSFILALRPAT